MDQNQQPSPTIAGVINLDGPCPPPPGKAPQPIPDGGHSLLPNLPASDAMRPLQVTDPDPRVKEVLAQQQKATTAPAPAASSIPNLDAMLEEEKLPTAKDGLELLQKMTPEQVQLLMEIVERRRKQKESQFELPELAITEDDKTNYANCLSTGNLFSQAFVRAKGALCPTFRVKTARETEIIGRQLRKDAIDGLIVEEWEWSTRLSSYNLLVQMHTLNDVVQPRAIPAPMEMPKDFNLREVYENSLIATFPDPKIYVLLGVLTQFDNKVRRLNNAVLGENF